MSRKHSESEASLKESLKGRLGVTNQRYQLFFQKVGDILSRIAADREVNGETTYSRHEVHISDFISVNDVIRLIETNELRDTESWRKHMKNLSDVDGRELGFDDWPEADFVLDTMANRHDATAQVYALNDSFVGFIKLLASWIDLQDDYSRLFSLSKEQGYEQTEIQLDFARILPEQVPDLLNEDLLSATVFIMEMVETGYE